MLTVRSKTIFKSELGTNLAYAPTKRTSPPLEIFLTTGSSSPLMLIHHEVRARNWNSEMQRKSPGWIKDDICSLRDVLVKVGQWGIFSTTIGEESRLQGVHFCSSDFYAVYRTFIGT